MVKRQLVSKRSLNHIWTRIGALISEDLKTLSEKSLYKGILNAGVEDHKKVLKLVPVLHLQEGENH